MRWAVAFVLAFLAINSHWAAAAETPPDRTLLNRVLATSGTTFHDLQSFVCDEEIARFRGGADESHAHAIDTVTASLSFENGAEHYFAIKQNSKQLASLSAMSGAWSEGEFGTLLQQTTQLMRVEPVRFEQATVWDSRPAKLYRFDVSTDDSPWELVIEGRTYRLAFYTEVWVDESSAQIVHIERIATKPNPETGIAELRWNLNVRPVELSGKSWPLPSAAQYSVTYIKSKHREWNEIRFTHYRRYGSEVALRFD